MLLTLCLANRRALSYKNRHRDAGVLPLASDPVGFVLKGVLAGRVLALMPKEEFASSGNDIPSGDRHTNSQKLPKLAYSACS